jgi:hypothetical protein
MTAAREGDRTMNRSTCGLALALAARAPAWSQGKLDADTMKAFMKAAMEVFGKCVGLAGK